MQVCKKKIISSTDLCHYQIQYTKTTHCTRYKKKQNSTLHGPTRAHRWDLSVIIAGWSPQRKRTLISGQNRRPLHSRILASLVRRLWNLHLESNKYYVNPCHGPLLSEHGVEHLHDRDSPAFYQIFSWVSASLVFSTVGRRWEFFSVTVEVQRCPGLLTFFRTSLQISGLQSLHQILRISISLHTLWLSTQIVIYILLGSNIESGVTYWWL